MYIYIYIYTHPPTYPSTRWVALLVQRYLSNTASRVSCAVYCQGSPYYFANMFVTFEEKPAFRRVGSDKRLPLNPSTRPYLSMGPTPDDPTTNLGHVSPPRSLRA